MLYSYTRWSFKLKYWEAILVQMYYLEYGKCWSMLLLDPMTSEAWVDITPTVVKTELSFNTILKPHYDDDIPMEWMFDQYKPKK